jgi:hypothetical protein
VQRVMSRRARTLRTRGQAVLVMAAGILGFVVLMILAVTPKTKTDVRDVPTTVRVTTAVFGIVILGFAGRLARCCAVLRDDGLLVRNPTRSILIAWSELSNFRIGRHGVWPRIGIVVRSDGSELAMWGIQDRGPALARPGKGPAAALIDTLNEARLAATPGGPNLAGDDTSESA